MKNTKVIVSKKTVGDYSGDLLVVLVAVDEQGVFAGDMSFRSLVESMAVYKEFSGKKFDLLRLYPPFGEKVGQLKCRRLLLLGLGNIKKITECGEINELLRIAGGHIASQCESCKVDTVGIYIPDCSELPGTAVSEFLTEGILLGDYRFSKYKTLKKQEIYPGLKKIELLVSGQAKSIRNYATKARNSAGSVITARDMANEPGNGWTASDFAKYANELAAKIGLHCTVFDKEHMLDMGMGGMIAVNQGSVEPPKLIILDYHPNQQGEEVLLLVGKGLTFDSGGISLKPAQGMMDMKYDMCGGAAVLSAMETIAQEKPCVRVIAIIPATDNMAGGGALKPGDVVTHYGGITSEIESTDAEGRLILADALAYGIEKYQPNCVIDIATLTGSVIFALGHHYSGLLCNNEWLAGELNAIGKLCGEPLWRLPLAEHYAKQLKSQVADIKNTGGKSAGCITAAEYLRHFVGKTPWAHLDIAGTAWDFTEKSYVPKGPSGFGVKILIEFLRRWKNGRLSPMD